MLPTALISYGRKFKNSVRCKRGLAQGTTSPYRVQRCWFYLIIYKYAGIIFFTNFRKSFTADAFNFEDFDCFFPHFDRAASETMLENKNPGTYLLRKSQRFKNNIILSYRLETRLVFLFISESSFILFVWFSIFWYSCRLVHNGHRTSVWRLVPFEMWTFQLDHILKISYLLYLKP